MIKSLYVYLITLIIFPVFAYASEPEHVSLINEASTGIKRLSDEAVSLAKTPFQIENSNILLTLSVAGAVGLTYIFDQDIQSKLQSNKSNTINSTADIGTLAGDPFIHLGLAALVYGGGIVADSHKWKETGEMMGEAIILADASTLLVKEITGRGRPNATSSKGDFKPFRFKNDFDSFPSMHTASSFALASVLSASTTSVTMKTAFYTAATFVGFSRMYKNKHWASDIILGAAFGELCGRVVTNYHATRSKLSIVPQAYENGAGLALVGRW